jgi:hypothetical protein
MEKNIILVDFENIQYIHPADIQENAKVIVFAGHKQNKRSLSFTMEILDKVSSIELVKIKRDITVEQKNALDFFIAHYLGIFIEKYRHLDLHYTIYSDDHGFDPLIKHLKGNNISIERTDKNIPQKEINSIENIDDTADSIKERYEKLVEILKKTDQIQRPKTRKGLKGLTKTLLHGKKSTKEGISNIILEMAIENTVISIDNKDKIDYNV